MLLKAAKKQVNKEDLEHLRLKLKGKELQKVKWRSYIFKKQTWLHYKA